MKVHTKDKDIELEFWYPASTENIKGHKPKHVVLATTEGHIMYEGRLMCGQAHKKLLEGAEADTFVIRMERIHSNPICEKCTKKYKEADWSPWKQWAEGVKAHAETTS
jgi:hypothetical protein